MNSTSIKYHQPQESLAHAAKYIIIATFIVWLPFLSLLDITNPLDLFSTQSGMTAALMFFSGAIIANSTAVGGGMIFNPMLQMVFGLMSLPSLLLSVVVQCSGMSSGAFGWYKKGEFSHFSRRTLITLLVLTMIFTALWSSLLVYFLETIINSMSSAMKMASAFISLYVFVVVISSQRANTRERYLVGLEKSVKDASQLENQVDIYSVDKRIYGWIPLGTLLNVVTAVGIGEIVFSHLIKYYGTPAKSAVAVGTLLQATSVITQTFFIVVFLWHLVPVDLLCIGLLMCAIGGRLAPYVLQVSIIEPYVKHLLAIAALSMACSSIMML